MYIPFSLSGFLVYILRSLGANQRLPTHLVNSPKPFLRSTAKGNRYFGLMMLQVLPFFTTRGVSQKGQLSEVTLGLRVDEAPHPPHFTVTSSCLSDAAMLFSFRNFSKSISSTTVVCVPLAISFCAPQYSPLRLLVPGANFKTAPQSLHFTDVFTSAVFSSVSMEES